VLTALQELCRDRPPISFTFSADIYAPTRIARVTTSTSSTGSPTPSTTNVTSEGSKISVGAIAGIAIGGLILIIITLCAILFVLRRIKRRNKTLAKSQGAEGHLGNYHELAHPAGGYADFSLPGAPKYAQSVPLGGYGHELTPAELSEQRALAELSEQRALAELSGQRPLAELPVGPMESARGHSPYRDTHEGVQEPRA
jgi:hypothetical protein